MTNVIQPFHLLVIALAGWLNRHQQAVIDYLIEENRVLKEQPGGPGTQAQSQPDTIPWRVCPEQQTPGAGDSGKAGQGQSESCGRAG